MSLARTPTDGGASPRQLLILAIPAIVLGAFAALLLWTLEQLADLLSGVLWDTLPDALGVDPNGWWIVLILTLTGLRANSNQIRGLDAQTEIRRNSAIGGSLPV